MCSASLASTSTKAGDPSTATAARHGASVAANAAQFTSEAWISRCLGLKPRPAVTEAASAMKISGDLDAMESVSVGRRGGAVMERREMEAVIATTTGTGLCVLAPVIAA